ETRAVNQNGQLWVLGGGRTAPNPSNAVQIYDVAGNTWSTGLPVTGPRRNIAAAVNPGVAIYLVGGYMPTTPTADMQIFRKAQACGPTNTPGPATFTPTATRSITTGPTNTSTAIRTNTATNTTGPV